MWQNDLYKFGYYIVLYNYELLLNGSPLLLTFISANSAYPYIGGTIHPFSSILANPPLYLFSI